MNGGIDRKVEFSLGKDPVYSKSYEKFKDSLLQSYFCKR